MWALLRREHPTALKNKTRKLVNNGTPADSFAAHFATHFKENEKVSVSQVRALVGMEVMWKGNPITCMKSFGTHSCALCMREHISILTLSRESPEQLINSCSEIYGACRYKTRFHRYLRVNTSTDDGVNPEKVGCTSNG